MYEVKVTDNGGSSFVMGKNCVQKVSYRTDIAQNSDARTLRMGSTLEIWGKITGHGEHDHTLPLANWVSIPAEDPACYRDVTVRIIQDNLVEREYRFPNAFVIKHDESYNSMGGIGNFYLQLKQREDDIDKITIQGGYAYTPED